MFWNQRNLTVTKFLGNLGTAVKSPKNGPCLKFDFVTIYFLKLNPCRISFGQISNPIYPESTHAAIRITINLLLYTFHNSTTGHRPASIGRDSCR